ncbi:MAG: hypothetical protein AAGC45_10595 [Bacteroidota bacterium]
MKKAGFHKTNEHVLIPILFILGSMSVITLIYFINELVKPEHYMKAFYLFDHEEIAAYKRRISYLLVTLVIVLTGHLFALKYKRWLYTLTLIIINAALLFFCIRMA